VQCTKLHETNQVKVHLLDRNLYPGPWWFWGEPIGYPFIAKHRMRSQSEKPILLQTRQNYPTKRLDATGTTLALIQSVTAVLSEGAEDF